MTKYNESYAINLKHSSSKCSLSLGQVYVPSEHAQYLRLLGHPDILRTFSNHCLSFSEIISKFLPIVMFAPEIANICLNTLALDIPLKCYRKAMCM